MVILVKGMVCHHCINAVKNVLKANGLSPILVSLGRIEIAETLDDLTLRTLDDELEAEGFKRILDADTQLVEQTKIAVINHVRKPNECRLNLSSCLEKHLGVPYDTISRVFSAIEGRTLEKYQMAQRVEWVKELLGYGQYTVSEIADITGYSSTAHLSRQFKSITGLTPTEYLHSSMTRIGLNEV